MPINRLLKKSISSLQAPLFRAKQSLTFLFSHRPIASLALAMTIYVFFSILLNVQRLTSFSAHLRDGLGNSLNSFMRCKNQAITLEDTEWTKIKQTKTEMNCVGVQLK